MICVTVHALCQGYYCIIYTAQSRYTYSGYRCIVINHFGAVLTVLPDSSLLVLRTIDNHPLGLQPGDIVLGYEGVPWKDLVDELLGSGIPILLLVQEVQRVHRDTMNWQVPG